MSPNQHRQIRPAAFGLCAFWIAVGGCDGGGTQVSVDAAAPPAPDALALDAAAPDALARLDRGLVVVDASPSDALAVADRGIADARVVADRPAPDAAVVASDTGPRGDAAPPDAVVVAPDRAIPDAVVAADRGAADLALPADARAHVDSAVVVDAAPVPADAAVAADAPLAPDVVLPPDLGRPAEPLPDLMIVRNMTAEDLYFEELDFPPDSCAIVEGCVGGPGVRRLLRFAVATANVGDIDFHMGEPADNPELFAYSDCHGHYHFEEYADYALRDAQGNVVAPGHKQAFCLLDSGRFIEFDPSVRLFPRYNCEFQGISRGWYDSYRAGLDCQWIDVTDVPPGDYDLEVHINPARTIREKTYENNDLRLQVRVPGFDLSQPCGPDDDAGSERMCGWQVGAIGQCQVGELVDAGCQGAGDCREAVCPEHPYMRVCAGENRSCFARSAIAVAQDTCGTCPNATFRCPESGVYTIWTAAPDPGVEVSCQLETFTRPEPPVDMPCGLFDAVDGLDRSCGWTPILAGAACQAGASYVAGCTGAEACGVGDACGGDPMLLVCPGGTSCPQPARLGRNDDSCNGRCPSVEFTCPDSGAVTVLSASYRAWEGSQCPVAIAPLPAAP